MKRKRERKSRRSTSIYSPADGKFQEGDVLNIRWAVPFVALYVEHNVRWARLTCDTAEQVATERDETCSLAIKADLRGDRKHISPYIAGEVLLRMMMMKLQITKCVGACACSKHT